MPLYLISELPPCEFSLDVSAARKNSGKIVFWLPSQKKASCWMHSDQLALASITVERAEPQRGKEAKYAGCGREPSKSNKQIPSCQAD